jgi:hypothetical protein
MDHIAPPLKLFAYGGRESGLMVVGSREALRDLAAKLEAVTCPLPAYQR